MRFAPVFATLLRALTLTLIVVSVTRAQEGNPIPDEELGKFLGPVSPDRFEWRVLNSVDFDVYYGKANPPLSGSVGFYIGTFPQDLKPGQKTSKSRLGRFPVKWSRTINADGSIEQDAIILIGRALGLKVHIWANAPNETQLDNMLSLVGQLPVFASGAIPDRFKEIHDIVAEEQRISRLIWICWSALVIAGAALVDRFCRLRRTSAQFRLLSFAGVIALAIAATMGGAVLSNNTMHWFVVAKMLFLLAGAGAVAAMAILLSGGLLVVRHFRSRNNERKVAVG